MRFRKGRVNSRAKQYVQKAGYILLILIYLIPVIWTGMTSLKPTSIIMARPPIFFFKPTLEHFISLYTEWEFFGKFWNSIVVSSVTTIICIVLGSLTAYSLSRYKHRLKGGSAFIPIWILSNRFFPLVVIVLPLFIFYKTLGLLDTYPALIIANLLPNLPLAVWLLLGFFNEVPQELDDAAKIDGCGDMGVIRRVLFPVAKSAIAVTAILVFLFSWNEFFIMLTLSRKEASTVMVAFAGFKQHYRFAWGAMSAAAMVCLLPLLAIVTIFHKHIVRGMTLGAVKG